MAEKIRQGATRDLQMRRIGKTHAIIVPPVVARVLNFADVERALRQRLLELVRKEAEVLQLRAEVSDLRTQLTMFQALPVDRDVDDPEVPQLEPPIAPLEAEPEEDDEKTPTVE